MKKLQELFLAFFKIGLCTFGGGYAMLPMIEKEIIEKKHWANNEEVLDYFAIGQVTPGVIAVNTATFIGYKTNGIIGAIVASLGVISPSVIIITIIASFLSNFADLPLVQHALSGVRIGVCVLMISSILKLLKGALVDIFAAIIFCLAFILAYFTQISTVILVISFAVIGIIISNIKRSNSK